MRRYLALLKDIPDLTKIKINQDTRVPQIKNVKRKISDLDKRALEAAIKLKESEGGEVVALSYGDEKTQTSLLEALAMGADSSYIVSDPELGWLDTNATSLILAEAIKKIDDYDVIITGEMTLDSLSSQMGPRLAELLDLPLVTYVREMELRGEKLRVVRDLEEVDEVVETGLPAVVSVIREVNEPRIPSLLNIMRAKKKPTTIWKADDLGLSPHELKEASYVKLLDVKAPKVSRKQVYVEAETVEEAAQKLADALINEGVGEG